MKRYIVVFLGWIVSLSAVEIPPEKALLTFSLRGIEVWLKHYTSTTVACRFISEQPLQGKPQIFDLDCPAYIFESELSKFLDFYTKEIQRQGGSPVGLVAVGPMDLEGLREYLIKSCPQLDIKNQEAQNGVRIFSTADDKSVDICLNYRTPQIAIQTEKDLKKLWAFYLIQLIAEDRLKEAAAEAGGLWVQTAGSRYLLPSPMTVGRGMEKINQYETAPALLTHFLQAIQKLKESGLTEEELIDCQSKLQRHLQGFYRSSPHEPLLADYYASFLAAKKSCPDYAVFMPLSLQIVGEVEMADISEVLKISLLDEARSVIVGLPEQASLQTEEIQKVLEEHPTDGLVFEPQEPETVTGLDKNDPFLQLPVTEEEEKELRNIIKTVAETDYFSLWLMSDELEERNRKLIHIHPLRSLAVFVTDSYIKQCATKVANDSWTKGRFIGDICKRMTEEAEKDNLLIYVPGFCQVVKANPDQIRNYINNEEYEQLIKYLLKLNNN